MAEKILELCIFCVYVRTAPFTNLCFQQGKHDEHHIITNSAKRKNTFWLCNLIVVGLCNLSSSELCASNPVHHSPMTIPCDFLPSTPKTTLGDLCSACPILFHPVQRHPMLHPPTRVFSAKQQTTTTNIVVHSIAMSPCGV